MEDNNSKTPEETNKDKQQEQDRKHHEEPATPIKPASEEVRAIPANESTKNSK
jgi:hypothetical protein